MRIIFLKGGIEAERANMNVSGFYRKHSFITGQKALADGVLQCLEIYSGINIGYKTYKNY